MRTNATRAIVASGTVLIAFGVWGWLLPPQPAPGYKLLSIQKLPEQAEICLPPGTVDQDRDDDLPCCHGLYAPGHKDQGKA